MTFGRVAFWRDFPQAFIDMQRANPVRWPVVRLGTGKLIPLEDQSCRETFYETGFCAGALVAYDLQNGDLSSAITMRRVVIANSTNPTVRAQCQQQLDQMLIDQAAGKFPQYAVSLQKALAVPAIAHLRVEGWRYQLWDADLAAKVAAACAICNVSNPNS